MLTPQLLIEAYSQGIFPMAENAASQDVMWIEPEFRGIIPLDTFHVPRSLKKSIRKNIFTITVDTCFEHVMQYCADRKETWINSEIVDTYTELHRTGHAHSVEVWKSEELVGGLYGVHIGSVFFGESMFSRMTNASKTALVYLVARLKFGKFTLLDAQFITDHLEQFGAIEIPQDKYKQELEVAIHHSADFTLLSASAPADFVLQLTSQIS